MDEARQCWMASIWRVYEWGAILAGPYDPTEASAIAELFAEYYYDSIYA